MQLYRNIRFLYVIVFFHNLIPAYVIERLFNQERGLSIKMVVYCEIIYAITIVLLEIPSGTFADLLGRKKSICVGGVMACLELLISIFAHRFWQFGLGAFVAGVGGAFTSGAWNALLYDSLTACGKQSGFERIVGRVRALDFIATMIAALSGGLLARLYGYVFNYWISLGATAIGLLFALLLKEPPKANAGGPKPQIKTVALQAWAFFRKHNDVLFVVLHIAVVAACFTYIDEFWQNYLDSASFPVVFFGLVSVLLTVSGIPGALAAGWLLERLKARTVLAIGSFATAIGILSAALLKNTLGIAGIALACFGSALMEPVATGYLHRRADDAARATIESASSLFRRGLSIVVGLLFGYIASGISIFSGYWMLGVACMAVSVAFFIIYRFREA